MSSLREESLKLHREYQGKLSVQAKVPVNNAHDLSLAYSPGVAEPCRDIHTDQEKIYDYTMKGNLVAVVSDGTAVLGLGNIGPHAAMPVMEGKAVLFKSFAGVDAFPLCLNTTEIDKIVETVKCLSPTFGGVNLEDIAAPNCFIIEERLKKELDIPVFHDDQHGTAIVTLAGLINALKVVGKKMDQIRVVASGAGAAGIAIIKLLLSMGVRDVIMCDSRGAIYEGRPYGMNAVKEKIAQVTNRDRLQGDLAEVIKDTDVFIGVSVAGAVTPEMVRSMNSDPIIFAMANPVPEIMPEEAFAAGAKVVGTGRSDYPNQVNNVLAFPGIFRGALDVRARGINEQMKIAAAYAIADLIEERELRPDYVIPAPFNPRVAPRVAAEVARVAMETGEARIQVNPQQIYEKTIQQTATYTR
ncbi:NADP-dependent malic enzyme [Paenactinomyces guangxiensis]|uniref:NAD-dependent malic enzyme n=1 Tax=Paenactinomyces guangxiensis TaxID=1490290 RepID=A0A7W1WSJ7_9BACL|nr:malic enzyme-like NAD(P)-binding protein [Paenactinomyces guangxiensis]MBA4495279.1 NAD-dependent malic enzyme [Paenactinomyces guangxiensis]MBH8592363.1 NAD-dependent malic enzyme [Paenactinomyces guangxiensis]